ncbi:MAG: TetR family transcriptional regulator [Thermoleophilia bacterium]|nr:TetR family transcriptional regulator [Thermoleophilia bacterium]
MPLPVPLPQAIRRSDATRNRALLLKAAGSVLADRGLDFTVGEVARAAGVGKGTAFRHFPSKSALIDAVLEERMQRTLADVRGFLDCEDAGLAFEQLATYTVQLLLRDRSLLEAMCAASGRSSDFEACRCEVDDVVEALLVRARDAGAIRPDLTPEDVKLLLLAVARAVPATAGVVTETAWRRPLALVLDGMRACNSEPLPN